MTNPVELLWPRIARRTADQLKAQKEADDADVAAIRATDWSNDSELALEEARSFAAMEKERRSSADSKASIYLAAVAAIVPIALPICTSFYTDEFTKLPPWLQIVTLALFFASVAYLIGAAWWAFRTFKVAVHHRIDALEYTSIWSHEDRTSRLVAELLTVTRLNRHMVNWKTTCVSQAHEFFLRALISFTLLIVAVVAWNPASILWNWIANSVSHLMNNW